MKRVIVMSLIYLALFFLFPLTEGCVPMKPHKPVENPVINFNEDDLVTDEAELTTTTTIAATTTEFVEELPFKGRRLPIIYEHENYPIQYLPESYPELDIEQRYRCDHGQSIVIKKSTKKNVLLQLIAVDLMCPNAEKLCAHTDQGVYSVSSSDDSIALFNYCDANDRCSALTYSYGFLDDKGNKPTEEPEDWSELSPTNPLIWTVNAIQCISKDKECSKSIVLKNIDNLEKGCKEFKPNVFAIPDESELLDAITLSGKKCDISGYTDLVVFVGQEPASETKTCRYEKAQILFWKDDENIRVQLDCDRTQKTLCIRDKKNNYFEAVGPVRLNSCTRDAKCRTFINGDATITQVKGGNSVYRQILTSNSGDLSNHHVRDIAGMACGKCVL